MAQNSTLDHVIIMCNYKFKGALHPLTRALPWMFNLLIVVNKLDNLFVFLQKNRKSPETEERDIF